MKELGNCNEDRGQCHTFSAKGERSKEAHFPVRGNEGTDWQKLETT